MSEILSVEDFFLIPTAAGWMAHFECIIAEMAVLHHATLVDPAEYGPALCAGSVLLADDTLITFIETADVAGQLSLAQDVDNWQMV